MFSMYNTNYYLKLLFYKHNIRSTSLLKQLSFSEARSPLRKPGVVHFRIPFHLPIKTERGRG